MLELCAFPAYILSNTFFLLVRGLTKHKMLAEFDVPPYERVTNVDTILALKSVTSALTTDVWNLFFF